MQAKNKIGMLFLYFTISILFAQCTSSNKKVETEEPSLPTNDSLVILTDNQLKNTPITTIKIGAEPLTSILKLNGKIDVPPQNLISISNPLGGYLKSTHLLAGMHVKKGEVIAIMEDPQYIKLQQDYLLEKNQLHLARQNYQRQQSLNTTKASSDKTLQSAVAEMNMHQINLQSLAQQLALIHINPNKLTLSNISKSIAIHSPIDGFVSKVNVNIGKYVTPADVLFELINPADIHLGLSVYENDISKLKIGQELMAYTNEDPNKRYLCKIILISKDLNQEGLTEVHCHFEQYDSKLIPGMYMNAEVKTHEQYADAIPESCILSAAGKHYVFIETKKQQYTLTPIEIGLQENGFTQIIDADKLKNKLIVAQNAYTLWMKLKNTESDD